MKHTVAVVSYYIKCITTWTHKMQNNNKKIKYPNQDYKNFQVLFFMTEFIHRHTQCFIYYRKYILKITQPSQYRCTQLQYRFAVISEAPSIIDIVYNTLLFSSMLYLTNIIFYDQFINKLTQPIYCFNNIGVCIVYVSKLNYIKQYFFLAYHNA